MAHCEIHFLGAHNKIKLQRTKRRCGEMADATDLKSVPAKAGYGFESHHRHPLKCEFTRENCWSFRLCALRTVAHENARNRCLFVNYSSSTRTQSAPGRGYFCRFFSPLRKSMVAGGSETVSPFGSAIPTISTDRTFSILARRNCD
jgi:hypothetical protein